MRLSDMKRSLRSPTRYDSPSRRIQPVLRLEEEDELVRALREHITLEREIENAKIQLAQRPDFNLFDAFRIFDIDSRGWISIGDLKYGLNEIGIFASHDEIELYFKRYDKNADSRIKFSEFCDSFTPLDNYYATILNRRTSNTDRGRQYARDDCFVTDTKLEFRNLWRTHFKIEVAAESLRQRLSKRAGFNLYEAFISCDLNDDGMISKDELRRLIESRGFFVSEKEMTSLVEKIDKDKDGRISYSEVSILSNSK
jgi:Ca2+-binding EF-hand superfamily protein